MRIQNPQQLAVLVKNQRRRLKLSQAAVGSLVGLKQKTISAFENKPEGTRLETVFQILSAVGLDIQLLLKNQLTIEEKQWKQEW